MHGVRQFPITLLCSIFVFSLIVLVPVQEETGLNKAVIFNLTNEDVPSCQLLALWQEPHFFSLVILRRALTEANLIVAPIVKEKLLSGKGEAVVVVLDEQGWVNLACHYIWDLFVVELKEVREGFGQKQTWEGNASDFCWNQRRKILAFLTL